MPLHMGFLLVSTAGWLHTDYQPGRVPAVPPPVSSTQPVVRSEARQERSLCPGLCRQSPSRTWEHSVLFTSTGTDCVSPPQAGSCAKNFIYHKSTTEQGVLIAALTNMQQYTFMCQTQFWPFYRSVFKSGQKNSNLPMLWHFNTRPRVRRTRPDSQQKKTPPIFPDSPSCKLTLGNRQIDFSENLAWHHPHSRDEGLTIPPSRDFRERHTCKCTRSIKKNIVTPVPSFKYIHVNKVPWRLI